MKDTVRYIFYIVLILAIGIGATYLGRHINRKFLGIEKHDETIKSLRDSLNSFIEMFEYGILKDAGKVSAEIAKLHAETEFEKYRIIQDRLFMSDYDKYLLELEENAKK